MKKEQKTQEQVKAEQAEILRLQQAITEKLNGVPRRFNDWSYQDAVNFKETVTKARSAIGKVRPNLGTLASLSRDLNNFYA